MSKTMNSQYDLTPQMAPATPATYSCPVCEQTGDAPCWCEQMRAAAQLLVDHEIYRPVAFLAVYKEAAKVSLTDAIA